MKTLMRNLATFIERVPVAVFPICSATGICQRRRGGVKRVLGGHTVHTASVKPETLNEWSFRCRGSRRRRRGGVGNGVSPSPAD